MRLTSTAFEVYWLPPGGKPGADEIPLHGAETYLDITSDLSDYSRWQSEQWVANQANQNRYPHKAPFNSIRGRDLKVEISGVITPDLLKYRKGMNNFLRYQNRSIITVLYGEKPDAFHITNLMGYEYSDEWIEPHIWQYGMTFVGAASRQIPGTYTVQAPIAVVRSDNGDGTYSEKDLIREIALDEWINRRYTW